jgi:hypothetical protein
LRVVGLITLGGVVDRIFGAEKISIFNSFLEPELAEATSSIFHEERRFLEGGVDVGSPHSSIIFGVLVLRKQQSGNI